MIDVLGKPGRETSRVNVRLHALDCLIKIIRPGVRVANGARGTVNKTIDGVVWHSVAMRGVDNVGHPLRRTILQLDELGFVASLGGYKRLRQFVCQFLNSSHDRFSL